MSPKAVVFSGYGLNCEEETKYALELAGGRVDIVHINDIIANPVLLEQYQIAAFPGGFSYGDDTGAGNAFANKVQHHLRDEVTKFLDRDTLAIGICNGFQIISNLGLVPAIDREYGKRSVALIHNDVARYVARWVDVKVENDSPWLHGIREMSLPIAHGEGKLFTDNATLSKLNENKQVALRYFNGEVCRYSGLPVSPSGSAEDIAGITSENGKVLGLMPHPERAIAFTHQPHWPLLAERMKRSKAKVPEQGPGLAVFKNAVGYFG